MAPAGFLIAAPSQAEVRVPAGAALVGRAAVLYLWPAEGWLRGTVARSSRAAGFSQVVRYGRTSALGSAVTPSRPDTALHGPTGRRVPLASVSQRLRSLVCHTNLNLKGKMGFLLAERP